MAGETADRAGNVASYRGRGTNVSRGRGAEAEARDLQFSVIFAKDLDMLQQIAGNVKDRQAMLKKKSKKNKNQGYSWLKQKTKVAMKIFGFLTVVAQII